MHSPDVVIAGAGLIGLACALECQRRGLRTLVMERGRAMQQASWAAAGMLAAHDPANPPALSPLAQASISLYPAFLDHIAATAGGKAVLPETEWTLERTSDGDTNDSILPSLRATGFRCVREHSLDPRKLAAQVLAAVHASKVVLLEDSPVLSATESAGGVQILTSQGTFACGRFIDCTGAWSSAPVRPAKGQMLRVHAPGLLHSATHGNLVVRTGDIYLVPRLDGSILIGATVEDAGFDRTVHNADLETLVSRAVALVPALSNAPRIECWAGLRPDTPDHLPLLGRVSEHRLIAAGHFRNGVLLAPATASIMVQLMAGEQPPVSLDAFAPNRFAV